MRQAEVDSIAKLQQYLGYRSYNKGKVYHYTNIGTIIKILRSGELLINNLKNVNDAMETDVFHNESMYVASFTYERKAVHYWTVYGKNDPYSVRISVDTQSVLENSQTYLTDDDNIVKDCISIFSDVIYFTKRFPLSKDLRVWKHNGLYYSLHDNETSVRSNFPGLCKYDIWEHEKETRLLVKKM